MQIKDHKQLDLYRRFIVFITSRYPQAIIDETTNVTMIHYPGELARIIISHNKGKTALMVKITQDLGAKMSDTNGKQFYLSTIDELNCLKYAAQIIMNLKSQPSQGHTAELQKDDPQAGQGYVLSADKHVIGIVDLSKIPTNAYIYAQDKLNKETPEEHEEKEEKESGGFINTISKFFN